ncbi:SDR family oxidoreductase [Sphingomonas sp. GM_Shp_1]|uniref:SDR family NAD(P)-dependent oxidoreductase n=1 Tax=Sphingomonas sp. GM_Shp_1 TaxID=2937381 RepID=UPI00226BBB83|nr:SDR family oxidoreductase [Sphingomonas sp. GM_Shp_1]
MVTGFDGRVAIVTGAGGGIGGAIAAALADAGAAVAMVDRTADALRHDDRHLAIGCDIADPGAVDRAVAATLNRFWRFDILVNVAGIMIYKPIAEQDAADWQRLLAVNLIAPALFTGHALRHMAPGGAIVNVASIHAHRTSAEVASYAASKAALVSLTRSTAIEGAARGIRCNAILPGAIDTPLLRASPNIAAGIEVIDPADIGTPADIASLALFLASDGARFVSGAELVADGGRMGRL